MLIALASKSGTDVDQHFGHAERFLIYDYNRGNPQLKKEVQVEKFCSFDPDQPLRHKKFQTIAQAIEGCRAVVTAQIGDMPRTKLEELGFHVASAEGPISQVLKTVHDALCGGSCQKQTCKE